MFASNVELKMEIKRGEIPTDWIHSQNLNQKTLSSGGGSYL